MQHQESVFTTTWDLMCSSFRLQKHVLMHAHHLYRTRRGVDEGMLLAGLPSETQNKVKASPFCSLLSSDPLLPSFPHSCPFLLFLPSLPPPPPPPPYLFTPHRSPIPTPNTPPCALPR